MLVIISDLHLTDGTSGATISPGAFEILAERIAALAVAASYRVDDSYRPLERLDVILLGDVLDVIRSARWLSRPDIRPWSNPQRSELVDVVTRVTSDILRCNDAALASLRELSQLKIPPADSLGRPATAAPGQPVDVKIHYLVGNHDWFFRLPGTSYNLLRQALVRHMGLANRHDEPFPHDPAESPAILDVLRRHRVTARHGDIFDPFNFEGDRNASSLGDAIVIDLINRFAVQVQRELGDDLPEQTILGLREIDNVRPTLLVPAWIDGLLDRTCAFPEMRKRVKLVWDRLADELLDSSFVRARDSWSPADLVDGLQHALKFSKRLSVGWAGKLAGWLNGLRGQSDGSYAAHALTEQEFRNRRARYVVYGHTHEAESVPLDASYAEGFVLNQLYFNAGTWRRVHRQTVLAPREHEFIASDTMTYLTFFQGDERRGRPYETWSGTLGLKPAEVVVHRVDAGNTGHVASQPVPPPAVHRHAPHFSSGARPAGIVPTRRVR